MSDAETRKGALQAIGRKLGVCFRAGDLVTIDGMTIERREEFDPERAKPVREYRFTPPPMDKTEPRALGDTIGGTDAAGSQAGEAIIDTPPEMDVSAYSAAYAPPMRRLTKTPAAPIIPDGSEHITQENTLTHNTHSYKNSKGALGGIGGTSAAQPPADLFDTPAAEDAGECEEGEL